MNGWYAFQAWLAADVIRAAWDPNWYLLIFVVTLAFGIPAVVGLDAMSEIVEKLVIPVMLLFVAYILVAQVIPAGTSILDAPAPGESIPFLVGVGLTWGTFAVSGTATGDIVRYAENKKHAVVATVIAFLICNTVMMSAGALSAAALNGADPYFGMIGLYASIPVVVVAVVSLWSTCDACNYGATMSYTNLSDLISWRLAGTIGIVAALITGVTEVISQLESWLLLIGVVVPPIGGIIIADYFILRRKTGYEKTRVSDYNWLAISMLLIAMGVNTYAHFNIPEALPGALGLILTVTVYPLSVKVGNMVLNDKQLGMEEITYSPPSSSTQPSDD